MYKKTDCRIVCLSVLICLMACISSCSNKKLTTLKPSGYEQVKSIVAETGDLKATFVENSELKPYHRMGYNGIAELYHTEQDSTAFVPDYAGFNLEHIFSGDSLVQYFEPRINPMTLYKKSNTEILLYQGLTPVSGVESLTEFKIVPPNYIDIKFTCILHDLSYFKHDYAGFFWASYINNPPDKNIYFKGIHEESSSDTWIPVYSEKHGIKSTHPGINDHNDFYFAPDFNATLANNFSDYRFKEPYYFGHFHNMILAFFFESPEVIRFSQSPTGGGNNNPAWDFQFLIPKPVTNKMYSFKSRMVYKPFVSNHDIEQEYQYWSKNN